MSKSEELLKDITEDIVIDIMEENGSGVYKTTYDGATKQKCLWFKTICHGGDSHKLCFFCDTKDFYCYTCCGRMPFFEFIKRIRNATDDTFYERVIKYVLKKLGRDTRNGGIGINFTNKYIREDMNAMDMEYAKTRRKITKDPNKITKFYDENILNYFTKNVYYRGWIKDGISMESMHKYEIEWYGANNYIIIPHRDVNGKLVGIRRRSLNPEDAKNKYMPLYLEDKLYDHPLSLNLYGLYKTKNAIKEQKMAIVVEGEKSVLLSDTYFGDNSITVATCGFNISDWQLNTLLYLGVNEIVLGFDKDFDDRYEETYKEDENTWREYMRYKERLETLASRIAPLCKVSLIRDTKGLLDLKDSPFDKGKKVFEKLFNTRKRFYQKDKSAGYVGKDILAIRKV